MRVFTWPPSLRLISSPEDRDLQVHDTDPCASLHIHGQGYSGRIQRQAAVSLSVNIIIDLEDGVLVLAAVLRGGRHTVLFMKLCL